MISHLSRKCRKEQKTTNRDLSAVESKEKPKSSSPLPTTTSRRALASRSLGRRRSSRRDLKVPRDLLLLLAPSLSRGCVPIVNHLERQNQVEREPGHESIQNQLVIHLLQRREDARKRSDEVVEHLVKIISTSSFFFFLLNQIPLF